MTYDILYTGGSIPAVFPIVHFKRSAFVFVFEVCEDDIADTPIDVSDDVFVMQIRNQRTDELILEVGTETGEITNPSTGVVRVELSDDQRDGLPTCKLKYEIHREPPDELDVAILTGPFDLT
jgi:hypothetical protein